jgi:hypothetical protein
VRVHELLLQPECGYEGAQTCWDEQPAYVALAAESIGYSADYCLSLDMSQSSFVSAANTANTANLDDAYFASANYSQAWTCYKALPRGASHAGIGGLLNSICHC